MDDTEVQGQLDGQDDQVGENVFASGGNEDAPEEMTEGDSESQNVEDPLYVQKRLKKQKRAHERELHELRSRMDHMQSMMQNQQSQDQQQSNPYADQQPQGGMEGGNGQDIIVAKAVSMALAHKEMQEQQAKQAQSTQVLQQKYQGLQKHLDDTSDKYDDFDEVVRSSHTPFTNQMRDAALMLPKDGNGSAGEVLYRLGKNPDELERISKLHPVDQVSEMILLSQALANGGGRTKERTQPLGNIKNNPLSGTENRISDKTSLSELKARMRAGKFK